MLTKTKLGTAVAMAVSFTLLAGGGAWGQIIPGGGKKKAECYAVFYGLTQSGKKEGKPRVDCTDGDASCDKDSTPGQCTFEVGTCLSQINVGTCTPPDAGGITFSKNTGNLPTTPLGSASGGLVNCAPRGQVTVPLKGKKQNKKADKKIVLIANAPAGTKPPKDQNTLWLRCKPCTGDSCGTTTTTLPVQATCNNNPSGGPRQLTFLVGETGNDLDNGVTGNSHNFRVPFGSKLDFCLTGCDASTNPVCQGAGSTGPDSLNGRTFGAPLPLLASGVPVCVVNRYRANQTLTATYNLQTGAFDMTATPLLLDSDVSLTNTANLCPRCSAGQIGGRGTCNSGPRSGQPCTTNGIVLVNSPPTVRNDTYNLSSECPPAGGDFQATLDIRLPLTTVQSVLAGNAAGNFPCPGQTRHDDCGLVGGACTVDCAATPATKGGINQYCCSSNSTTPCFPTSPGSGIGQIVRQGAPDITQPAWPDPTYPKTSAAGAAGVLAATFCEQDTGSNSIDTTTGLPGPGSLLLRGTQTVTGNQ